MANSCALSGYLLNDVLDAMLADIEKRLYIGDDPKYYFSNYKSAKNWTFLLEKHRFKLIANTFEIGLRKIEISPSRYYFALYKRSD